MDSPGKNLPRASPTRPSGKAPGAGTLPLWPVHLKPLPDELLSSWLVRLAHAHGLKVQTFCRLFFGNAYQVWNRDIDRQGPEWLTETLCRHTATPPETAKETTLQAYEGVLYRRFRESSTLQWILPLFVYHRTRKGFGLQFCPRCLTEDAEPYFRKRWRVAFCTYCPTHGTMLHDCCPHCGAPIAFHRRELGRQNQVEPGLLTQCFDCGFDFREAPSTLAEFYEGSAFGAMNNAVLRLEHGVPNCRPRGVRYYNVLHHLCWLLTARYRRVALLDYVNSQVGGPILPVQSSRVPIEARSIKERHHLVQLAFWLLADVEPRLTAAWKARAVTYSALLRDFHDRPDWYDQAVGRFSDWRREFGNTK